MIKINDKTLKALKEQLETIQENGIYNVGFFFGIFKEIPADELLYYAEKAIQDGLVDHKIKDETLKDIALQAYLDDLNPDDENDLKEFSLICKYFLSYNAFKKYTKQKNKLKGRTISPLYLYIITPAARLPLLL